MRKTAFILAVILLSLNCLAQNTAYFNIPAYKTDFTSSDKYFYNHSTNATSFVLSGAGYQLTRLDAKVYEQFATIPINYKKDFLYEFTLQNNEQPDKLTVGMAFLQMSSTEMYNFVILGSGYAALFHNIAGKLENVIETKVVNSVNKSAWGLNKISLEKIGRNFKIYINGQLYADVRDVKVPAGEEIINFTVVNDKQLFKDMSLRYRTSEEEQRLMNTKEQYKKLVSAFNKTAYSTDFRKSDKLFSTFKNDYGTFTITERGYEMMPIKSGYSAIVWGPQLNHDRDFLFETSVKYADIKKAGGGSVYFLYNGDTDRSYFWISGSGVGIFRQNGSTVETIIPLGQAIALNTGPDEVNKLSVFKSGNIYSFFVNEFKVGETSSLSPAKPLLNTAINASSGLNIFDGISVKYRYSAEEARTETLIESYTAKANTDYAGASVWRSCAEAVKVTKELSEQALYHRLQAIILTLKANPAVKDRCPCEDAIPLKIWNAAKQ